MDELQHLILKMYNQQKEINSYEAKVKFMKLHSKYTLKEVEDAMAYLDEHGYIESSTNKYHTLKITKMGERVFAIKANSQSALREDLPALKPTNQPKIVERKMRVRTTIISFWDTISNNPLISAIIAAIISTLILRYFHII